MTNKLNPRDHPAGTRVLVETKHGFRHSGTILEWVGSVNVKWDTGETYWTLVEGLEVVEVLSRPQPAKHPHDHGPCEPKPAPTPSVEQMCRNLLAQAVRDNIALRMQDGRLDVYEQIEDISSDDLAGMANMLAGFLQAAKAEAGKPAPDPTPGRPSQDAGAVDSGSKPAPNAQSAFGDDPVRDALQKAIAYIKREQPVASEPARVFCDEVPMSAAEKAEAERHEKERAEKIFEEVVNPRRIWPTDEEALRLCFEKLTKGLRALMLVADEGDAREVLKEIAQDVVAAARELEAEEAAKGKVSAEMEATLDESDKTAPRLSKEQVERILQRAFILEECHKLDTPETVYFYENDFYVLSNFSAFNLKWKKGAFPTSEHAYHWEKFEQGAKEGGTFFIRDKILNAPSAHEAFKIAEAYKHRRRPDWDSVKVGIMRDILRAKAQQHEYVRRKLLATGNRTLIEDSWRDDFWGWGPNRDGKNMLGKLWMDIRDELRAEAGKPAPDPTAPAKGTEGGYIKVRTSKVPPGIAKAISENLERGKAEAKSLKDAVAMARGSSEPPTQRVAFASGGHIADATKKVEPAEGEHRPCPTGKTTQTGAFTHEPAIILPDGRHAYPFRLEGALRGEEVVTREGSSVVKLKQTANYYPLSGECRGHSREWPIDGSFYGNGDKCPLDLFMLHPEPTVKECLTVAKAEGEIAKKINAGMGRECSGCHGIITPAMKCYCCVVCADTKANLAPFDLARAKAGEPVCLADGTVVECRVSGFGPPIVLGVNPDGIMQWCQFTQDGVGPWGVKLYMANNKGLKDADSTKSG